VRVHRHGHRRQPFPLATVTLTVAKSGAQYTTVQAAVNAVPDNSSTTYVISIASGTYKERVTVPATKRHLTLEGADHNAKDVVITSADYSQETNPATGSPYGTEGSATVHVKANDFTAEYVTFSNTFDKTAHSGVTGTQAVAIAMEGDRQQYLHDIFYGHQDTLLTWGASASKQLRQYVYGSEIDGDVDFIFGNGSLVVDRSTVNALNDGIYSSAYLTAPATPAAQKYGILITGSTVNTTLANNTVYLGRAWKPSTDSDPQVVIRNTVLPQAVNASGPWLGISGATWTSGRYGEYANSGPGASRSSTSARPLLDATTAASYMAAAYLAGADGWNPVVATTSAAPAIGDRRDVREPRLPAVCETLKAGLPGGTRTFGATDEATPPDTGRIQAALDACAGIFTVGVLVTLHYPAGSFDLGGFKWTPFLAQFGVVAGYQISWAIYVSDYSRYLPPDVTVRKTFYWTYFGSALGGIWLMVLGSLLAAWAGKDFDTIRSINAAGDKVFSGFGAIVLLFAALGLVSVTALNMYGGSLTLISAIDSFRRVRPTLAVRLVTIGLTASLSLIGALAATSNFLENFNNFLLLVLYLFIPWTAVNLMDYYIVRRGHYAIAEIFNPRGIYGRWGRHGIIAYLVGFAAMVPFFSVAGLYVGPAAKALDGADISLFVGLPVAALLYWLLTRSIDVAAEQRLEQAEAAKLERAAHEHREP